MDGVLCLRIKSASLEVRLGKVLPRACRWDVRGARLARREDARELRAERTDEDLGIGAIARSSLEGEDVVRSLARCDANASIYLLFGCCSRQSACLSGWARADLATMSRSVLITIMRGSETRDFNNDVDFDYCAIDSWANERRGRLDWPETRWCVNGEMGRNVELALCLAWLFRFGGRSRMSRACSCCHSFM
jgi:hypothetical protein